MAKIIIKDSEISSSAGINIPGSLTVSGNAIIGDNFTDTLVVNSSTTFNDDITVLDTISGSIGRFTTISSSIISASQYYGSFIASAAGTAGQIQFNSQNSLSSDSNLHWDNTNKRLGVGTSSTTDTLTVSGNIAVSGSGIVSGTIARFTSITGSLSGNSSTATTLQTTRAINGTNFNGSAAITTANWGTARTITIGNTGKSVNGSANVSWTLTEIGAAQTGSNNTFTGVNTFNTNYITGSITGSDAKFISITGTLNGNITGNAATVTDGVTTTNIASNATTGVTAGNGLTGGGTVGSLTLNVGAGDGISVAADSVAVDSTVVRTTTAQSVSGPKTFTDYITGSITGSDAKFTNITGSNGYIINNLGIGTTNPSAKLTVDGVGGTSNSSFVAGNANASLIINYANGGNNYYDATNHIFRSGNGATNFGLWNSTGLGIGTTSPNARLDVDSAANAWARWRSSSAASSFMSFVKGGTSTNVGYIGTDGGGILGGGSGDHFGIRAENALLFMAGAAERARITSTGNVGIGTTSPSAQLSVKSTGTGVVDIGEYVSNSTYGAIYLNGDFSVGGNYNFASSPTDKDLYINRPNGQNMRFRMNNADQMFISASGYVGIGTTSPQRPLDVVGTINDLGASVAATIGIGSWTGLHFGYRADSNEYRKSAIVFERTDAAARGKIHILNDSAADAGNATLADAKLTIDENGNVGIATTTPNYTLAVTGTLGVSGGITGTLTGNASSATQVNNSITFNNAGAGASSGTTFNGSAARTISYNTIGAPSTSGTGATGTWGISITGNAATVTNGVYTNVNNTFTGINTFNTNYITGSITGSDAKFTRITGSFSGAGAGLTGIPNGALTNSSVTIGTTSVSLGSSATTIQGITVLTGSTVTGSTALFTSVTGTFVAPLGSVTAPSYTFSGDSNTGIYSPSADTIVFVEGGTEAMRINSSGQVIVGTTNSVSSDVLFQVSADRSVNAAPLLVIEDTNGSSSLDTTFGRLTFRGYNGSTTGASRVEIRASYDDSSGASQLRFMTATANGGINTKMILDSSGNLGINTTTSTTNQRLTVSEQASTSTSSYVAEFRGSSTTNNAGRFVWSQGSTYALALNVQGTGNTAGTTEFQWINRSTGVVQSTPLKFDNISNGNVTLPDGNLVIGTSGKGISFANTTPDATIGASGSLDSELLDDYEEGSFTPTFSATSATFTYAGSANYGRYVKIGNMVTAHGWINLASRTSNGNSVTIQGLPFTAYSTGASDFLSCPVSLRFSALTTAVVGIWGSINASSTSIQLYKRTAAAVSETSLLASDLANTSVLYFSVTYRTT